MNANPRTDTTSAQPAPAVPAAPRNDAGLRTSLRILAVGLSLIAVGWCAFTAASLLARVTAHRSATYDGVRSLDVDLGFESVEIVAGDDTSSVTMTRSYTWSLGKPSVTNRLDGGLLSISSSCPFTVGLGCSGHVRLVVPKDLTVQVHNSDGSLTLRDLTGSLDLSTSDGSIHASNLTGPVKLHSDDGSMTATGLRSDNVEATTADGSIRLSFEVAPSSVTADTSDGSIEVVVPDDGTAYNVTATTGDGSKDVSVPTDPNATSRMKLSTGDGSIKALTK
jgi:Putative adhesin